MHKPKIYLDISVIISLLNQQYKGVSLKLWDDIKKGLYNACISEVSIKEITSYDEPRRSALVDFLEQISYEIIAVDEKVKEYTEKMLAYGVLLEKTACLHVGCAVVGGCDIIISLNYKEISNVRTITGVRFVNKMLGFKEIGIYPPSMVVSF